MVHLWLTDLPVYKQLIDEKLKLLVFDQLKKVCCQSVHALKIVVSNMGFFYLLITAQVRTLIHKQHNLFNYGDRGCHDQKAVLPKNSVALLQDLIRAMEILYYRYYGYIVKRRVFKRKIAFYHKAFPSRCFYNLTATVFLCIHSTEVHLCQRFA